MAKTPIVPRKAQQLNIEIDKGSTFRASLVWKVGEPAVPKDLTGYTGRMQIRPDVDSPTIYHEMTTANGGISIDGPNGKISLFISDTDSTGFDWDDAVYGLELIDSAGNSDVRRLVFGDVTAFDEVTR